MVIMFATENYKLTTTSESYFVITYVKHWRITIIKPFKRLSGSYSLPMLMLILILRRHQNEKDK